MSYITPKAAHKAAGPERHTYKGFFITVLERNQASQYLDFRFLESSL
jgi:hypothetical protein